MATVTTPPSVNTPPPFSTVAASPQPSPLVPSVSATPMAGNIMAAHEHMRRRESGFETKHFKTGQTPCAPPITVPTMTLLESARLAAARHDAVRRGLLQCDDQLLAGMRAREEDAEELRRRQEQTEAEQLAVSMRVKKKSLHESRMKRQALEDAELPNARGPALSQLLQRVVDDTDFAGAAASGGGGAGNDKPMPLGRRGTQRNLLEHVSVAGSSGNSLVKGGRRASGRGLLGTGRRASFSGVEELALGTTGSSATGNGVKETAAVESDGESEGEKKAGAAGADGDEKDVTAEELRGARYTTEDDEREEPGYEFKLDALTAALTGDMRAAIARRTKDSGPLSSLEKAALAKGVDFERLRDLKAAFDTRSGDSDAPIGITEADFFESFAPTLCAGMNVEQIRLWFRSIDRNCSGTVSWTEISQFLLKYRTEARDRGDYFVDTPILGSERTAVSGAGSQALPLVSSGVATGGIRKHKQPISHLVYSRSLDVVYSASGDGLVLCWQLPQLRTMPMPIHRNEVWVTDLRYLPHDNRVLVLQADRSIFIYDSFQQKGQLCHQLWRAFGTLGKTVRQLPDSTWVYDRKVKIATTQLARMNDFAQIPMSLLEACTDGIMSIDHLGGASTGEPVVWGLESGHIECVHLFAGSTKPLKSSARFKVHENWVTKVQYAPELQSIISCSLDESVCVTDIEKGVVLQRMTLTNKKKPLFGFHYHKFHNTLVTFGGRTVHVWNALTGAKLNSLAEHEAPVVRVSLNHVKLHLYVLCEDKSVKVWDVRSWRSIGSVQDTAPRYPSNQLQTLLWCESHHLLLSGCAELFGWRPFETQERIDAGLSITTTTYTGHLHPIHQIHLIESAGHIIAIDSLKVLVWGVESGLLLHQWTWPDADNRIACSCVDLDGVRLLIGTEYGGLTWWNYACAYRMYGLNHSEGRREVTTVAMFRGVNLDSPPMAVAGIGQALLAFNSDRLNVFDIQEPLSVYRLPTVDHGTFASLSMVDTARQIVGSSTTGGFYMLLTLGLAPLCEFRAGALPCDRIIPVFPSLFVGLHPDGKVRFFCVNPTTYEVVPMVSFQGSHEEDDAVIDLCVSGDCIVVADVSGFISIFRAKKLLNWDMVQKMVLPPLLKGDPRPALACQADIALIVSFVGHRGAVSSIAVHGSRLFTASVDRHIRCWAVSGYWDLVQELGMKKSEYVRAVSTADHEFNRVKETGDPEEETSVMRKLSFANGLAVRTARRKSYFPAELTTSPTLSRKPTLGEEIFDKGKAMPRNYSDIKRATSMSSVASTPKNGAGEDSPNNDSGSTPSPAPPNETPLRSGDSLSLPPLRVGGGGVGGAGGGPTPTRASALAAARRSSLESSGEPTPAHRDASRNRQVKFPTDVKPAQRGASGLFTNLSLVSPRDDDSRPFDAASFEHRDRLGSDAEPQPTTEGSGEAALKARVHVATRYRKSICPTSESVTLPPVPSRRTSSNVPSPAPMGPPTKEQLFILATDRLFGARGRLVERSVPVVSQVEDQLFEINRVKANRGTDETIAVMRTFTSIPTSEVSTFKDVAAATRGAKVTLKSAAVKITAALRSPAAASLTP